MRFPMKNYHDEKLLRMSWIIVFVIITRYFTTLTDIVLRHYSVQKARAKPHS